MRAHYEASGVRGYYEKSGSEYKNPHDKALCRCIRKAMAHWEGKGHVCVSKLSSVLDVACGSGEATLALRSCVGIGECAFFATDPYTHAAYSKRVGAPAMKHSFKDISQGLLGDKKYSLIVSSFALHLMSKSLLWACLTQLSERAPLLLVCTPHKRPHITENMGWTLLGEVYEERVRARLYKSTVTGS